MEYAYIVAGLLMLFIGGEVLVKGSVAIARHMGLSDLLVGTVIVGFGTSMPEMAVSVGAALGGSPDIALGNVVGSNIANILLILGICVMIYPIMTHDRAVTRDTWMVIAVSMALCGLSFVGIINFVVGFVLISALTAYILYCYRHDRSRIIPDAAATVVGKDALKPVWISLLLCVGGLALLIFGARFLVDGAVAIARGFGLSEAVIGLTLVAVGTSLPELATGVVAAIRKNGDVIIGNILGSNIFNILAILGITGMIAPVPFGGRIASMDIWVMLGVAVLLLPLIKSNAKLVRAEGAFLVFLYAAYIAWMADVF